MMDTAATPLDKDTAILALSMRVIDPTYEKVVTNTRFAGRVKRYHTWPTLHEQTVDEHTWHVMRIYVLLWGIPEVKMWYFIQYHDCGELRAGDMPTYAKLENRNFGDALNIAEERSLNEQGIKLPTLTWEEHIKFKVADIMERWEFAQQELAMGNKFAEGVLQNVVKSLEKLQLTDYHWHNIRRFIREESIMRY